MSDEFYMRLAIEEAWKYQGLTYPNPAVGAVVVKEGEILAITAHQRAGTSHAEVLALLGAYEKISGNSLTFERFNAKEAHHFLRELPRGFFSSCCIYVTLEPCSHKGKTPSCALLLEQLHLARVIVGTPDPIEGHSGGIALLENVCVGVEKEACDALLEPFKIWQKRAFVLFKLAQTTNGRIGGGYLSAKASLRHVHQLRNVCDTLLIGGNTVREDRPTLDCRFSQGRAPHIKIYSQRDDFEKDIPLFHVKEREVEVTQRLDWLEEPSFVMVEGGEGMLNALKEKIDWLLIYQTPKLSTNSLTYNTTMNLTFLHTEKKGVDMMLWSRNSGY